MTTPKHTDPLLGPQQQNNPHIFGDPMPGQGSARICTQCGERENSVNAEKHCNGPRPATLSPPTKHHYDPMG